MLYTVLSLTAVDPQGHVWDFACPLDQLEAGLYFLHAMALKGYNLVNVRLLDGPHATQLPVKALTGPYLARTRHQLEAEWTALLASVPATTELTGPTGSEWAQDRIGRYEQRIAQLQVSIARVDRRLQQARSTEVASPAIQHHYQSVLAAYSRALFKAYQLRQRLLTHF